MSGTPVKLTSKVNYWPARPEFSASPSSSERYIGDRPIYVLDQVKALSPQNLFLVTERSRKNVAEQLDWDIEDVHTAVARLDGLKHFKNAEWCRASSSAWLPCDAYVIRKYDDGRSCWPIDLYIKYGLSLTGDALLIVSCHL